MISKCDYLTTGMVTKFESEGAKLRAGHIDASEILEPAIAEIDGQLEANAPFLLYGKVCRQRRNIGFFADPKVTHGYFYSGVVAKSKPPGEAMHKLIAYVNALFGSDFNAVLVNYYCDGEDYISDHSDNEAGLDAHAGVVIVSAGATRTMHFKKAKKATSGAISFAKGAYKLPMKHGSVVAMQGPQFQQSYTHGIPKEKAATGPRWSFTFRVHVAGLDESDKIAKAEATMAKVASILAIEAKRAVEEAGEGTEGAEGAEAAQPPAKRIKMSK